MSSRLLGDRPATALLTLSLGAYCALKLVLLGFAAVGGQYVMDEYAQGGYSIHIGDGFYRQLDPVKTVLYAYFFAPARRAAGDAAELMRLARLQGLALAFGMVALTWGLARNLGRSRPEALFAAAALLSFSNFMERSFRVRSDTLAAFLAAFALWLASRGRPGAPRAFSVGIVAGAAFLSTQKAAYAVLALALGMVAADLGRAPLRDLARRAGAYAGGLAAALLAYGLYFGGLAFPRVLAMVFTSPLDVALRADDYYPGLRRYLWQSLGRNAVPYLLCLAGLAAALAGWRRLERPARLAAAATAALTLLVFLHNQPWPYVFVLALPALAAWGPQGVEALTRRLEVRRALALLLALALLAPSLGRNFRFLERDNALQDVVVRRAESLLGPRDRYADGLWMVPTRRHAGAAWWDAPTMVRFRRAAAAGDLSPLDAILAQEPKLWIVNYRVRSLWPLLRDRLLGSYVPVDPNILLAGALLPGREEAEFVNRWGGPYRLYGAAGRPLDLPYTVDGSPARGVSHLPPGSHRIALRSEPPGGAALLLPAGLELAGPLPARSPPRALFVDVYE